MEAHGECAHLEIAIGAAATGQSLADIVDQIVVLAALGDGGGGGSGSRSLDRLLLELDRHGEVFGARRWGCETEGDDWLGRQAGDEG